MPKAGRVRVHRYLPFAVALLVLGALACLDTRPPIIVGSQSDTQSTLISQMIVRLLDDARIQVIYRPTLGDGEVLREALLAGAVNIYPEYTGNGASFYADEDASVWRDPQAAFELVRNLDAQTNDVIWLEPAPVSRGWVIAIRRSLAESDAIETVEDFARFANGGGRVLLAGPTRSLAGEDGLSAFEAAYGFSLSDDQVVPFDGSSTASAVRAAQEGWDGVNASLALATDGQLTSPELLLLDDPLHSQRVLAPAPAVTGVIMYHYPEIQDILATLFKSLDVVTLRGLNARVDVEGEDVREVAAAHLEAIGLD